MKTPGGICETYLVRANMPSTLLRKVDSTLSSCCFQLTRAAPSNFTHLNVFQLLGHDLLAGIVDQDINLAKLCQVFLHNLLALLRVHEVMCKCEALLAVLLDGCLDALGTGRSALRMRPEQRS